MATEGGKALVKWSDYDKDRVKQSSTELMKRSRSTYDRIGSLPSAEVNYENTLKASLNAMSLLATVTSYAAKLNARRYNTNYIRYHYYYY